MLGPLLGLHLNELTSRKHTRATPSPRVDEKAYRTFTVGSSHLPLISGSRLRELVDLLLEDCENRAGEIARLELVDVRGGPSLCAFRTLSGRC